MLTLLVWEIVLWMGSLLHTAIFESSVRASKIFYMVFIYWQTVSKQKPQCEGGGCKHDHLTSSILMKLWPPLFHCESLMVQWCSFTIYRVLSFHCHLLRPFPPTTVSDNDSPYMSCERRTEPSLGAAEGFSKIRTVAYVWDWNFLVSHSLFVCMPKNKKQINKHIQTGIQKKKKN